MNTILLALITMSVLGVLLSAGGHSSYPLRRSYYAGITVWSRWLPVMATGIYLAILAVNLTMGRGAGTLNLSSLFSVPETIVLFAVGPLFLTRLGNILAGASAAYCTQRLLVLQPVGSLTALHLLIGAVTTVAVLADRMPWVAAEGPSPVAQKLREILLALITIGALAVVLSSLLKAQDFAFWVRKTLGWRLSLGLTTMALMALFFGWLTVALQYTRHLAVPLLALPTLVALAFVTGWPSYLLSVPFVICFALSLVTADRRLQINRRGQTIVFTH